MPHHYILRNALTNASAVTNRANDQCFSHQQWSNMLAGRSPLGGKTVSQRNRNDYLTFAEVQMLTGKKTYDKSVNVDYLCIKLPNEVEIVDTVRNVTPSWNIDIHGIRELTAMINNDFKRAAVEWAIATFDFCTSNGRIVCRAQQAMLERFLMRYEIYPSETEKDSLRRIIERWLKAEHNYFYAYSSFNMQYIDAKEKVCKVHDFEWQ